VACRSRRAKEDLLRIARRPDGRAEVDGEGRAPGRGAYVCREAACVSEAAARLPRALRTALSDDDLARLRGAMERELA
jgi:uncharacterized protein